MKKRTYKRKLVDCQCDQCGNTFQKAESEFKRNLSLKRKNFCSRNCSGKHNLNTRQKINTEHLRKGSSPDEYTPFRYYLRSAQNRLKDFNLTLEDLKTVWTNQNGICPYSGIKLQLSTYRKIVKDPLYSASLDRIDSSKGYVVGNVQFVARAINFMKHEMSHEQTQILCQLIAQNHSLLSK